MTHVRHRRRITISRPALRMLSGSSERFTGRSKTRMPTRTPARAAASAAHTRRILSADVLEGWARRRNLRAIRVRAVGEVGLWGRCGRRPDGHGHGRTRVRTGTDKHRRARMSTDLGRKDTTGTDEGRMGTGERTDERGRARTDESLLRVGLMDR